MSRQKSIEMTAVLLSVIDQATNEVLQLSSSFQLMAVLSSVAGGCDPAVRRTGNVEAEWHATIRHVLRAHDELLPLGLEPRTYGLRIRCSTN